MQEIGFEQYSETFLVNFPSHEHDGYLSRKRLSLLRLKDFSQLNITQYDHQKLIFEHIKHTLQFEFRSPIRRRGDHTKLDTKTFFCSLQFIINLEVSMRTGIKFVDEDDCDEKNDMQPTKLFPDDSKSGQKVIKKDHVDKKKGVQFLFLDYFQDYIA